MIAIILMAIAILLAVNYFLAEEFYKVAVLKGYSEKTYFWLCFLCTICGYLLVIALPTKKSEEKEVQKNKTGT